MTPMAKIRHWAIILNPPPRACHGDIFTSCQRGQTVASEGELPCLREETQTIARRF